MVKDNTTSRIMGTSMNSLRVALFWLGNKRIKTYGNGEITKPYIEDKAMPNKLFEFVDISAIPKTHRGKQNPKYDEVLKAFKKSEREAVKINCSVFGEVKESSIAHTFRMRIKDGKLKMSVQLDAHNKVVYLKKTPKA